MIDRPIRRKDRQLPQEEALDLLNQGVYGVLSVTGDEGWPYGVPMHYVFLEGNLYLHCAKEGHMLESIARDDRVCFTVVPRHELVPDHITALYESVMVFGTAALVEEADERQKILEALVDRLAQVSPEIKEQYIRSKGARTGLVRIRPARITAKASRAFLPVTKRM
ncbi:MAG: pyridoxamine 5'-phosphate oxidase family protein [Bacillota bacterium]|nr:pyridoxamine 5'-phosphate oxidase family protein [Bacillota bacterium]